MGINATLSQFLYSFIDVDDYVKVYSESDGLLFEGTCKELSNSDDVLLLDSDVTSVYAYDVDIIAIQID
jgi:hypothetical protein